MPSINEVLRKAHAICRMRDAHIADVIDPTFNDEYYEQMMLCIHSELSGRRGFCAQCLRTTGARHVGQETSRDWVRAHKTFAECRAHGVPTYLLEVDDIFRNRCLCSQHFYEWDFYWNILLSEAKTRPSLFKLGDEPCTSKEKRA